MMTRAEYIESLRRLNLKVYFMGELIENPVDHPMIRPSMNSVAKTYELAEKPEYQDLMTVYSPLIGKRINRFCHLHQSTEDLVNKVKMQRLMGQRRQPVSSVVWEWMLSMPFSLPPMRWTRSLGQNITSGSLNI